VSVIGSGYVGTVVAACLARLGHSVIAVESDRAKLAQLTRGRAPFFEPGLDELISEGLAASKLQFSDDLAHAMANSDIVFLCVGTPSGEDGLPDMGAMVAVARTLASTLRHRHILVTKSTVPIGSGRWLASVIDDALDAESRELGLFSVVSNPEFLREGNAVDDYFHPDRVVLGSDDLAALEDLVELYQPILQQDIPGRPARASRVPVLKTDLVTAEMTKYASNAFLATKISFANEIARLCDLVGADIDEVTMGMGLDPRIGEEFLNAGIGWGGSCFGKDVAALCATAREYGYQTRILDAAYRVNDDQRHLVVEQLFRHLKTLRGARVALLGLSFKPGTDDVRDSPALDVARRLINRGVFVDAYDPVVRSIEEVPEVRLCGDPYRAAKGVDAVVLATEWPEFLELDLAELRNAARGDLFFDGRNFFDPKKVEAAGFRYLGIGRKRPAET
jgi:nucleotide sugar dehydrogenase